VRSREQQVYKQLLSHLNRLRAQRNVWITTPGEVNRWWRQRAGMKLIHDGQAWRIEGPGSERAQIAFATEKDGRLIVSLQSPPKPVQSVASGDMAPSPASLDSVAVIPSGD
jgi:hypothetical protein